MSSSRHPSARSPPDIRDRQGPESSRVLSCQASDSDFAGRAWAGTSLNMGHGLLWPPRLHVPAGLRACLRAR